MATHPLNRDKEPDDESVSEAMALGAPSASALAPRAEQRGGITSPAKREYLFNDAPQPSAENSLTPVGRREYLFNEQLERPEEGWARGMSPRATGGYGRLLSMGGTRLVQSALGLADLLGMDAPDLQDRVSKAIEKDYEKLSPDTQKLVDAKWASLDENSVLRNPEAILAKLTVELPTLMATMFIPLGIAGRAGAKAGELAAKAGASRAAVNAAREKAADKTGTIAGAAIEGAITAGASMDQIRTGIEQMPLDTLLSSAAFREVFERVGDEQAAREEFTDSLAGLAAVAGGVSAVLGGTATGYLSKLLVGSGGTSRLGNIARGAAVEGPLTEMPQEFASEGLTNLALQQADASTPLYADPLETALASSGLGAVPGGAVGAFSPTSPKAPRGPAPPRDAFDRTTAPPGTPGGSEAEDLADLNLDAAVDAKKQQIADAGARDALLEDTATRILVNSQPAGQVDYAPLDSVKSFLGSLDTPLVTEVHTRLQGKGAGAFASELVSIASAPAEQQVAFAENLRTPPEAPVLPATEATPSTDESLDAALTRGQPPAAPAPAPVEQPAPPVAAPEVSADVPVAEVQADVPVTEAAPALLADEAPAEIPLEPAVEPPAERPQYTAEFSGEIGRLDGDGGTINLRRVGPADDLAFSAPEAVGAVRMSGTGARSSMMDAATDWADENSERLAVTVADIKARQYFAGYGFNEVGGTDIMVREPLAAPPAPVATAPAPAPAPVATAPDDGTGLVKAVPPAVLLRTTVDMQQMVGDKVETVKISAKEALRDLRSEARAFRALLNCLRSG